MAKIRRGEKTAAVQEYINSHPGAMPVEIVAALADQGITITRAHVSNIKGKLQEAGKAKKKAAKSAADVAESAPTTIEKPAKPGDAITLEQIRKVSAAVKWAGGFHRMTEVLEVIRELGGLKKFKEVAEAISCPDTYDDIPF